MTSRELEVLVDLGNVTDLPDATEPGPGWVPLRSIRIAVIVVTALLLLGAAGATPRPRLTLVVDASIGDQTHVLVAGGRIFVDSTGAQNSITAYRADDGKPLWSVDEHEQSKLGMLMAASGAIVVSSFPDPQATSTEAFDAATGRRLWTSDLGEATLTSLGVLVQASPSPETAVDGSDEPSKYELLDAHTGAVIWTFAIPDGCVTAFDESAPPTMLAVVCVADSSVRVVDLADGRTVAERLVPLGQGTNIAQLDPAEVMEQPQVMVVAGTILIAHANVPIPTVDAYASDTLTPRWSGLSEQQAQFVDACGDAICFYTTPDAGIRINAATGRSLGPVVAPPAVRVAPGTLELAGPAGTRPFVIPTARAGVDIPVGPDGTGAVWLERAPGELIAPLPGVGRSACAQIIGDVVCATVNNRIRVWRLS